MGHTTEMEEMAERLAVYDDHTFMKFIIFVGYLQSRPLSVLTQSDRLKNTGCQLLGRCDITLILIPRMSFASLPYFL